MIKKIIFITFLFLSFNSFGQDIDELRKKASASSDNELVVFIKKAKDQGLSLMDAEKQLILIDDFHKIKYSFLFTNRVGSWKSKLAYKKFQEIISAKGLNTFEVYSSEKGFCYLALTKNKNLKMGIIFNLKNLIFKYYILFWFYHQKKVVSVMFKRFIIFLLPHQLYIFLKKYYKKI